ncbi:translation initiation factor IF-2-like [Cygnus atratus]|uniref:translation initiation factor IF-2-like n=1 Tax=Cygnus atratus TaxID=8868 RepID=UPI0015D572B3|nr:translation initiation factor IF-2-like [Cygnus atratus]
MRRRMLYRQPRGEQERKPGSQQEKQGAGGEARPALTNGEERLSQAARLPPSSATLPPRCIRCSSSPCRARLGSARPGPAPQRSSPGPPSVWGGARPPHGSGRLGPAWLPSGRSLGNFPRSARAETRGSGGCGCGRGWVPRGKAPWSGGAENREKRKATSGWGSAAADLDSSSQMTFKSQVFSIRLKKEKNQGFVVRARAYCFCV